MHTPLAITEKALAFAISTKRRFSDLDGRRLYNRLRQGDIDKNGTSAYLYPYDVCRE